MSKATKNFYTNESHTQIDFNQNFRHSNNLSIVILEFVKETYWKLSLSSEANFVLFFKAHIMFFAFSLSLLRLFCSMYSADTRTTLCVPVHTDTHGLVV